MKPNTTGTQQTTQQTTTPKPINAKALCKQIMQDMKTDLTKMISSEIKQLNTDLTSQKTNLSANIKADFNSQITAILATIAALNQCFTEVMDQLPTNPTMMPAHKKSKGLGVTE